MVVAVAVICCDRRLLSPNEEKAFHVHVKKELSSQLATKRIEKKKLGYC